MAYELCCTKCDREFTIEVLVPGDRAKCPECGGEVVVPESPKLARPAPPPDHLPDLRPPGVLVQVLPTLLLLLGLVQVGTGILLILGPKLLGLCLMVTGIGSFGLSAATNYFLTSAERLEHLIRERQAGR